MAPDNLDKLIKRSNLPLGNNLSTMSTRTMILFTALRRLLSQAGGSMLDGSSSPLSELVQQYIIFTLFTFLSTRASRLWVIIKSVQLYITMDLPGQHTSSKSNASDDSYRWLMEFWQDHPSYKHARNFVTQASIGAYNDPESYPPSRRRGKGRTPPQHACNPQEESVNPRFRPTESETFWFVKYGTLFRLQTTVNVVSESSMYPWGDSGRSMRSTELRVRVFSVTRRPLIKLLTEARDQYEAKKPSMLSILIWDTDQSGWRNSSLRHRRPFSSIIMDEANKTRLLKDANEFLQSEQWYASRGIAWKRGYLLWGPPGSGKSSTIQALATELDLPVYIVPIAGLSDYGLGSALRQTPARCICVFEDIDVVVTTKRELPDSSSTGRRPPRGPRGLPPPPPPPGWGSGTLTLAAVLNAVDGIESAEGRILCMTTNNLAALDPALIRPGRVDLFLEYSKATQKQARQLFEEFYRDVDFKDDEYVGCSSDETLKAIIPGISSDKPTYDQEEVARLALKWSSMIEDYEFTCASLQGLLLMHKDKPRQATDAMAEWVRGEREQVKAKEEEKTAAEAASVNDENTAGPPELATGSSSPRVPNVDSLSELDVEH